MNRKQDRSFRDLNGDPIGDYFRVNPDGHHEYIDEPTLVDAILHDEWEAKLRNDEPKRPHVPRPKKQAKLESAVAGDPWNVPLRFLREEYQPRLVVQTGLWEVWDSKNKVVVSRNIPEREMAEQECSLLNARQAQKLVEGMNR